MSNMPGNCCPDCFFRYIVVICRAFGIIVCISIWGISVNHLYANKFESFAGWYLMAVAFVLTFFEIIWIIDQAPCVSDSDCCRNFWKCLLWVEDWRKTILYTLLTIPLFWNLNISHSVILIAVILIILLGIFYSIKSFDQREPSPKRIDRRNSETTEILSKPYTKLNEDPDDDKVVAIYKVDEQVIMADPGPKK